MSEKKMQHNTVKQFLAVIIGAIGCVNRCNSNWITVVRLYSDCNWQEIFMVYTLSQWRCIQISLRDKAMDASGYKYIWAIYVISIHLTCVLFSAWNYYILKDKGNWAWLLAQFPLGVIHKPRGHHFALFWPPTYLPPWTFFMY